MMYLPPKTVRLIIRINKTLPISNYWQQQITGLNSALNQTETVSDIYLIIMQDL